MNNIEFVKKLSFIAENCATLYVLGGFGIPLTAAGKQRVKNAQSYNRTAERAAKIDAATAGTFGFDCVGLIKSVIWGFNGDPSLTYGGAVYKSNGLADVNTKGMYDLCHEKHDPIPETLMPGEYLYMAGHCGIYAGSGKVIECTPIWEDGVQYTQLNQRRWLAAGKLPVIDYVTTTTDVEESKDATLYNIRQSVETALQGAIEQLKAVRSLFDSLNIK